jgi:alpha-ketoglutarate-dependent taurine dioxygenase
MNGRKSESEKPGGPFPRARRKAFGMEPEEWVRTGPLDPERDLPLLVVPALDGVDLAGWAERNRPWIEEKVLKHGAVLFRNFTMNTVADFEHVVASISAGGAVEYRFRASPRTQVGNNIYTSTDYPATQPIFPHNEHSYSPVFPLRLFFHCVTPAAKQGETPIADCRRILQRISPAIRDEFAARKIMYVRNYNDGFGLPWQTVFQTSDEPAVEEYCRRHDIEFEWKSGGRLRTRQIGPAIVRHPRTGEHIWFNHGTFFHISTLPLEIRAGIEASCREEDYPTNTYFGDGGPIDAGVLDELRQAYLSELVVFPWQAGDVLMLDNILAAHGRRPYAGARRVLTAMAEPTGWKDVQIA